MRLVALTAVVFTALLVWSPPTPGTAVRRSGSVHCNVGRTVLVRVRVTFAPWRGWRRYPAATGGRRYPAVLRGLGKPQSA
jgi:hypothetical protein